MGDLLYMFFHAPWLFLPLLIFIWALAETFLTDKKKELEDKAKEKEIREFLS